MSAAPSPRDRVITSEWVEWTYGVRQPVESSDKNKVNQQPYQQKKKEKKGHQQPKGPKIELDLSDSSASKSLLGCFFGNDKCVLDFKSKHFQYQPVVSRGHNIEEIKDALFQLNVKELVNATASDQIHVWLKNVNDSSALDSITVDDADQACKLFAAGHSLYCRAPASFESIVVPKLIQELSYGIDTSSNDRFRRGEVETFFTRRGHQTDFHSDFQENFTIQLTGSKKWILATSTASHPIRGCTPHFNRASNQDVAEQQIKVNRLGDDAFRADQWAAPGVTLREIILNPGDVMYHPAGIWHRVECLSDSISINISLTALSVADVFCSSLQQLLMEQPRWRSAVFHESQSLTSRGRPSAEALMQSLLEAVPKIVASLHARDLLPFPVMRNKLDDSNLTKLQPFLSEKDDSKKTNDEKDDSDSKSDEWDGFEEVDDSSSEGCGTEGARDEEEAQSDCEFVVRSSEVNVLKAVSAWQQQFQASATQKESTEDANPKKRPHTQGVFHDFANAARFRFNPFAMILSEDELVAARNGHRQSEGKHNENMGNDSDNDNKSETDAKILSFIVHCGYGNETLESAARARVCFPSTDNSLLSILLADYHHDRERRLVQMLQNNMTAGKVFTANDILARLAGQKKKKGNSDGSQMMSTSVDVSDVIRVLISWQLSGALTLLD